MSRTLNKIRFFAALAMLCGALPLWATRSNSVYVDCRDVRVATGAVYVAPSRGNASAVPKVDGVSAKSWRTSEPYWDSATVPNGWHTLTVDGESATPRLLVLNDGIGIVVHEGVLTEDETWGADAIHVVCRPVVIPEGVRLTVESGAIVKFCQGTEMQVEGTLLADGAVFTALADDSAGGDTDCNGETAPVYRTYAVGGAGTISAGQGADWRWYCAQPNWSAPTNMQYSMSVSVVVSRADGTPMENRGNLVGFFDRSGNCRGVAQLRSTAWGAWVFQGQLFGNETQESGWTIRVWDVVNNRVVTAYETLDFEQDAVWGTARAPKELHAAHHVYMDGVDKGWFDCQQTVTMKAAVPQRKVFKVWTVEGVSLSQAQREQNPISFTMPDNDVRLYSSFYVAHHVYMDGVDMGWFNFGQTVTMKAAVPRRKVFDVWTVEGISLALAQRQQNPISFAMPDNDVRLFSSFMYPSILTWTLDNGWNWVSVNLEPNADISYVLREYAPSDGDQIKTSDCFSTYYSRYGCWDPEIPIVSGRMYAFYRKGGGTAKVDIRGDVLPDDNFLYLSRGWNWIGCFTPASSIAKEDLSHSTGFSDGDQLKGHGSNDFAGFYDFDDFYGWDGVLTEMTAGKGYKMKVARAGTLSVEKERTRGASRRDFAVRSGRSSDVGFSGPWAPPEGYAYSMTLEAEVKDASGRRQTAPGSVVGIFDAEGSCRGIASLRTTKWDTQIYGGQVLGDNAAETGLTLRFWDAATGNVRAIQGTIDFAQDTSFGTAVEPKLFTVTNSAPAASYTLTVNGKAMGGYCAGDELRVVAPEVPAGQRFRRWTASGVMLADATAPVQSFTMPAKNVTLTADFEALPCQPPEEWILPEEGAPVTTVFGTVCLVTDEMADEAASMVAVFDDDGVCRGVGVPDANMSRQGGCSVYLLQVAADGQAKGLSMKFWSQSEGTVVELEETLDVTPGAVVGDVRPLSWNVVYVEPDWKYATMDLKPGWNAVTPTLKLSKETVQTLLAYAPMTLKGGSFTRATEKDILPGSGLWLYNACTETQKVQLKGEAVEDWQLEVGSGWQFVGALKDVSSSKVPSNVEAIMEWKPAKGYMNTRNLLPGAAYWIKAQ